MGKPEEIVRIVVLAMDKVFLKSFGIILAFQGAVNVLIRHVLWH